MDNHVAWKIIEGAVGLVVSLLAWLAWRLHARVDRLERDTMSRIEIERGLNMLHKKLDVLSDRQASYREETRAEATRILDRLDKRTEEIREIISTCGRDTEHRLTALEHRGMAPCSPSPQS